MDEWINLKHELILLLPKWRARSTPPHTHTRVHTLTHTHSHTRISSFSPTGVRASSGREITNSSSAVTSPPSQRCLTQPLCHPPPASGQEGESQALRHHQRRVRRCGASQPSVPSRTNSQHFCFRLEIRASRAVTGDQAPAQRAPSTAAEAHPETEVLACRFKCISQDCHAKRPVTQPHVFI